MLCPPNFVIAPGSRRPFLKVFDRSAETAVAVDFSSVFRRLRAFVPRTLQPLPPNFFRRFSLLDPDAGPPRPEAGIRPRDDRPCAPVDVLLDAVTQERRGRRGAGLGKGGPGRAGGGGGGPAGGVGGGGKKKGPPRGPAGG